MSTTKSLLALASALALSAAFGTAQATVVKSVAGKTTTYTENFDHGATSFNRGEYSSVFNSDGYLWLTDAQTSSWSFTTATALQSVTVSFAYAVPGADTGWFKFGANAWVALADTPGTAAQFAKSNPSSTASADSFDAMFTRTYTNLAAGTYTLSFAAIAPDCDAVAGLKIDDLSVTTVAAVPEPETNALMLAGLLGVCFVARRRLPRHD